MNINLENVDNEIEVECLYYFDGPLLSHVRIDGRDFLKKWATCDRDKGTNTWVYHSTDAEEIGRLKQNLVTLREVEERHNNERYFVQTLEAPGQTSRLVGHIERCLDEWMALPGVYLYDHSDDNPSGVP